MDNSPSPNRSTAEIATTLRLSETLSPQNQATLARLVQILDYAEGFTLLLACCDLPLLRQNLIKITQAHVHPLGIRVIEIEFTTSVQNLRDLLRARLAAELACPSLGTPKLVLFVNGLELSIPADMPYTRILAELNLGREFFLRDTPLPLLLWLPDYAITMLARYAPDFWSWHSGLFEFA